MNGTSSDFFNNTLKQTLHFGQTNPLMFSTTPMMGRLTFLQKLISFLTSCRETSCGEVSRENSELRPQDISIEA